MPFVTNVKSNMDVNEQLVSCGLVCTMQTSLTI